MRHGWQEIYWSGLLAIQINIRPMSNSNLSKELQELIKSIGETKSKQEEDRIILNELSTLKPRMSEKNISARRLKEYLIIALYIEMLGHSASFCHIEAINLTQNKNLVLKRIGYLMCSLFFTSKSDLTIMLISTIQKDLASTNIHEIVICLTSLDSIMNSTIASAISESVIKLLAHTTDLVRKKAVLVLQKMQQVTGTPMADYKDKMKKALCDREPSVMAASLNLYMDELKENPRKYRDLAPSFVIILKQVIEHKLPKEFDYHRLPAPWIQMKLMQLLEILGKGDLKASEHSYTILQQALKRTDDGSNNIAFAVSYQCVKTICNIYPNPSLIQEAANSLNRFLQSHNSNVKYMGIKALGYIYKQQPELLENYQLIIVDCLESKDEALKRETLELLYRMTNNSNVEVIVAKILNSLHSSTDPHFRNALVLKINALVERFAPNPQWYIETMCLLFELGSEYLTDEILNNFLKLVMENCDEDPSFIGDIVEKMKELLNKIVPTDFIIKVSSWVFGEMGSRLTEADEIQTLTELILSMFDLDYQNESNKVWVLDSLIKLSSTKNFSQHEQVKQILNSYSKNFDILLCQRSLESKKLAKYNAALRLNNKLNFNDDLDFLAPFVETAKKNGAKPYQKMLVGHSVEAELNLTPYSSKKIQSSFPFKTEQEKKVSEQPEFRPPRNFEGEQKPFPATQIREKPEKPKKAMVTPEERARRNLANNIFSGVNKPKPAGKTGSTTTQSKKEAKDESLI